jgi:hypothetical protein
LRSGHPFLKHFNHDPTILIHRPDGKLAKGHVLDVVKGSEELFRLPFTDILEKAYAGSPFQRRCIFGVEGHSLGNSGSIQIVD